MQSTDPPSVTVLAGCNGSGKSTAASRILTGPLGVKEFVNADVIARGLSAFQPGRQAFSAGKIMLRRLAELAAARESFAFETTLASRTFGPWIAELAKAGYEFRLFFFYLPSPDMAVDRVAARVQSGGHHVPETDVRRRYDRGLRNFFGLYLPLATEWFLYNNQNPEGPGLIAQRERGETITVESPDLWEALRRAYDNG